MVEFENKLVAVINKDLEPGIAMNALAHMSLGLGGFLDKRILRLDDYIDNQSNIYPNISQVPYIILRAKSNEIRKTVTTARENNLHHTVFLNTMTGGTYLDQLEKTKEHKEEDLIFYGCAIFGPWAKVSELTKKFSLFK